MVDPTDGLEYAIGQGYSALDAQAARSRLDGFAVVTGLTPTAGSSGLEVDIASGDALVGTDTNDDPIRVSNSGTTVTLSTADSQYPRKDVVYVDSTGTIQVAEGGADPPLPETATGFNTYQPEPPLVATGTVLAEVFVAAGATTLASGDVRDRRQPAETVASTVRAESVNTDDATINNELTLPGNVKQRGESVELSDDEAKSITAQGETIIEVVTAGAGSDSHVGIFVTSFSTIQTASQIGMSNEGSSTLSGTSGPDDSLNISRNSNDIYLENRTGKADTWEVGIRGGVK